MGLVKCPECGKEISDTAVNCPNCGKVTGQQAKQKKKSHGCLITFLVFIVMLILVGVFITNTAKSLSGGIQQEVSGVSSESEYITLEEFNAIESGMTYEAVQEIVGSEGTVSSEVEAGGTKVIIVTWYGNGVAGSNASVTFTNNEMSGKAQVGLE